jgi:hypothetical protein
VSKIDELHQTRWFGLGVTSIFVLIFVILFLFRFTLSEEGNPLLRTFGISLVLMIKRILISSSAYTELRRRIS